MTPFKVELILAIHDRQLAEHGGLAGVRDMGMLESALGRAQNKMAYGDPDAFEVAAAYAFGAIKNHPFVDGNKRTGFVLAETWLVLAGHELIASDIECIQATLDLAAGEISEAQFARWLADNAG
jgi:death-on-curing protein